GAALFPQATLGFALRNVWIGLVVTGLALRYFYVAHEWRRSVELRAAARVHALQARIRPHFLFNSMNTIAALTRSNPARAEAAVQDLADLFRATLSDKRDTITLAEELEVARTYQRMEQLRLGGRLNIDWKTDPLPAQALVPSLVIQPLLENAIYHGIEPRAEGGTVTISGEVSGGLVTIVVRNPLDPVSGEREGNRLALANIRERRRRGGRRGDEQRRGPHPHARALARCGAARCAHAGNGRTRGGAASERARGAAGGDLHHRLRHLRGRGFRGECRGVSAQART